ncbi:MAG: DUF2490 domain-containing protein [Panacibacter sp.]
MKKMLLIFLWVLPLCAFAQNRINEYNKIGWYSIFIMPKISDKISAQIEYQWRRSGIIKNWQQSLSGAGIMYKINDKLTIQTGYALLRTYPTGSTTLAAVPKTFPEHRIYEQLTVKSPIGKAILSHRLRLEQRWIGKFDIINSNKPDSWVYLNRIRYMPRLDIPLSNKFYAEALDELAIGFGKNVGENVFDQNRFALMAGYKLNKYVRIEAGYLNQTLQLGRRIND